MSRMLVPSAVTKYYIPLTKEDGPKTLGEAIKDKPWFPSFKTLVDELDDSQYESIAQITVQMLVVKDETPKIITN